MFLESFGEFVTLDLIDETDFGGGNQTLNFYNETRVISCIDLEGSEIVRERVLHPAFYAADHLLKQTNLVIEVGDTGQLKLCISRMRHVESVFDAYRVTPGE